MVQLKLFPENKQSPTSKPENKKSPTSKPRQSLLATKKRKIEELEEEVFE